MAALIVYRYALPASISIKDNQSHVVIDNLALKIDPRGLRVKTESLPP
jgi:hypothetical protein